MGRIGKRVIVATAASLTIMMAASTVMAEEDGLPSRAEMWRIIQQQAAEIEALKQRQSEIEQRQTATAPLRGPAERSAPVLAVAPPQTGPSTQGTGSPAIPTVVQNTQVSSAQEPTPQKAADSEEDLFIPVGSTEYGYGRAGLDRLYKEDAYGRFGDTVIGSYGEFNYNNNDSSASRPSELDMQRFVLYVGHEFNDRIRFFSEIEIEHTFIQDTDDGGTPGQISVEQAFAQFDIADQMRLNAGILLMPLGILNEIHEPVTFFGVERNPIESQIIPSTFREGGIGLQGAIGSTGISYDALFTTGLNVLAVGASGGSDNSDVFGVSGSSPFDIRGSRTQVARTRPRDPALTGRLKYTGIPGLELAASVSYNFDITQGVGEDITADGIIDLNEKVDALLFTTHVDWLYKGWGLRALYAQWWLGGTLPELTGEDIQRGLYVEPSYRFDLPGSLGVIDDLGTLGFFYRYENVDEHAGSLGGAQGFARHGGGLNYWPHPSVVLKADYFYENRESGADANIFNLGLGYSF